MTRCQIGPLEVKCRGEKSPRLNLLVPLYGRTARGRKRADFTRAALASIKSTPRKENA